MKLLIIICICVMTFVNTSAQNSPKKKVVYVDYVTSSLMNADRYHVYIKKAVIESLSESGAVTILDSEIEPYLNVQKVLSEDLRELDLSAQNKKTRMEKMKSLGADYWINIHTHVLSSRMTTTLGTYIFNGLIEFDLKLTDLHTGEELTSIPYVFGNNDVRADKCVDVTFVSRLSSIRSAMYPFCLAYFGVEAKLLSIATTNKKGKKAETLYINCGHDAGKIEKLFFDVYIDEKSDENKIGRILVIEVKRGDLSLCEVKDGGEEIKTAFDQKSNIILVSKNYSFW